MSRARRRTARSGIVAGAVVCGAASGGVFGVFVQKLPVRYKVFAYLHSEVDGPGKLTALKYEYGEQARTDVKFFGLAGSLKKNWLKRARRKLF